MNDIDDNKDVILLVDRFYEKVKQDAELGYIFNDVAKIDWEHHLPAMYSFWNTVLFASGNYKGNPIAKHIAVNQLQRLEQYHFDVWLRLFKETVTENFYGNMANLAIAKAENIAALIAFKIKSQQQYIIPINGKI